jgi:hypothetical protein
MLIAIVDAIVNHFKGRKLTVNAIKVIVDFADHTASLYDSIAERAPVT